MGEHEVEILTAINTPQQAQGFSPCHVFCVEGAYHCLVMEMLGQNLEQLKEKTRHQMFSVRTTTLAAVQILARIEYLHSKGIVHRDIKPENFAMGLGPKAHHIYLIDFGLSKKYWIDKHIIGTKRTSLTGTARYASINAHKGCEQGRRDDLEAIANLFIYFLRGKLPWSGLPGKTTAARYNRIKEVKEQTDLGVLCRGCPNEFRTLLSYSRNLQFQEKPDYDMLNHLMHDVDQREGPFPEHGFEWLDGLQLPPMEPLQRRRRDLKQPDEMVNKRTACFWCSRSSSSAHN